MTKGVTAVAMLVMGGVAISSAACSGDDDDANTELTATWKFESGDCASNAVDKVHVTVTPPGGAAPTTKDFACSAGTGDLGKITTGSYGITAEGLDAAGKSRFISTQSASFPQGKVLSPLDLTLRPKPSKVTVTWRGCPPQVILPYQVTLYRGSDATATNKAATTSASCQASSATLDNVLPGTYTAEVDSRAVTPAVRGTQPVTVVAGEDATVAIPVP